MIKYKKVGRPKLMSEDKLSQTLFHVFAAKGYASTSIADLTQATGMKPASLYLAFGNKEGMYAAALGYYRQTWLSELQQTLNNRALCFKQRITAFLISAFTLFSCSDKPLGCMMTFSALAFQAGESELANQLSQERAAFVQWLEEEARQAQRDGQLSDDMTPATFASFIITLERGLALGALDKPDPQIVRTMLEGVITMLFKGK